MVSRAFALVPLRIGTLVLGMAIYHLGRRPRLGLQIATPIQHLTEIHSRHASSLADRCRVRTLRLTADCFSADVTGRTCGSSMGRPLHAGSGARIATETHVDVPDRSVGRKLDDGPIDHGSIYGDRDDAGSDSIGILDSTASRPAESAPTKRLGKHSRRQGSLYKLPAWTAASRGLELHPGGFG